MTTPIEVDFSGPFGSSPVQTETQWTRLSRVFGGGDGIDPAVYGQGSGRLSADGAGMWVYVAPYYLHVGGAVADQPTQVTVPIPASDSSPRIDRVVTRREPGADRCVIDVLRGTPGAGSAPSLTQDAAGAWEYSHGEVHVAAGATNVPSGATDNECVYYTRDGRRRALTTFPPDVVDGEEIIAGDRAVWRWYAPGSVWERIEPATLLDVGDPAEGNDQVVHESASTADWRYSSADGIARLEGTFVAPSNGQVEVIVRGSIQTREDAGAEDRGFISAEISGPNIGTFVPSPHTAGAARSRSPGTDVMAWYPYRTLVPLATYTATFVFQSTGGRVTYGNRRLAVRRL